MDFVFLIISLASLLGCIILALFNTSLQYIGKVQGKEMFASSSAATFLFRTIFKAIFPKQEWEYLHLTLSCSKHVYQIGYAVSAFTFFLSSFPSLSDPLWENGSSSWSFFLVAAGATILTSLLSDCLTRLGAIRSKKICFQLSSPLAILYLLPVFPWVGILLRCGQLCLGKLPKPKDVEQKNQAKLREIIRESELQSHLDPYDQKLLSSFLNFKERVAKEIMVPRVDLFSLSADTTIAEASQVVSKEGYSRIPIYKDTLDQIVGVVLYKDLLKCYASETPHLSAFLETIAKPVLYTPENKKVSQLLQEFRTKQIHMAIVVDEYGGTEGILTIEDILEELVGEIEDEYDIDEEHSFLEIPGGGWIIDAKMTLLDIADQIGIHIPTHPDYETLGGYVYHCAGTIPSKGWRLSHDEFDLEVISSNERGIKKIKIIPRKE